ncbi:MAG: DUF2157 domain-containing protein [Victivallaceae bacterium]|nr:DUF2157 domain-containing protein [Victivallaceae bacterium]
MDETKWFLDEIDELRRRGIVDEETAKSLSEYFNNKQENAERNYFMVTMTIIGVALMLSGAVIFCACYFNAMPQGLRLAISGLPLAVGFGVGCHAIITNQRGYISEGAAALSGIGIAVLYGMLSRVYSMECSVTEFAMTVMTFCLPIVYIFDSMLLATFYSIGLLFITGYSDGPLMNMAYLLAIVPFALYKLRTKSISKVAARYIIIMLSIYDAICFAGYYPPLFIGVLLVLGLYGGWEIYEHDRRFTNNPWLPLSFALWVLFLALISCRIDFFSIPEGGRQGALCYWIATGGLIALLLAVFPREHWDAKRIVPLIPILLSIVPISSPVNPVLISVVASCYMFLFGAVLVHNGMRKRSAILFNGGLAMLAALVTCRLFDFQIQLLHRAIGLVALGAIFLAANAIFAFRHRKADKQTEVTK